MSALSDVENLRLHDIADGDVRDDPRWLTLMGEGAVKTFLAEMAAKHLPGQHNQQSHAGLDVNADALKGFPLYGADEYAEAYGDVIDEENVHLGGDGDDKTYLSARFFRSGEGHVALDLPGGRSQPLEEMKPDAMRALADSINDVVDGDAVDADNPGAHNFYIAEDGGDIRLQVSNDEGETDYLDLSANDAAALAEALNKVADAYEDYFAGNTKGRRRIRRKHLPGRHNQDSHGNDNGLDVIPGDKLGLAKRIQLGPGEKLLSSRKIRADEGGFEFAAAEVDTPTGRQVRLGIVVSARHWAAGPNPKRTQRLAEIHAEIGGLEERDDLTDAEEARLDQLNEERLGLNDDDDYNRTAVLTPSAVAELRARLAEGAEKGRAHKKAFDAFWDSEPDDDAEGPDTEAVFAEGHIPGGAEGDLHYRVAGYDDGEGSWDIDLGIKPPGADDSWTIGGIADDKSTFEGSHVAGLLKALAELSGDLPKSSRRDTQNKHLPGRHDQSSHGRGRRRGVSVAPTVARLTPADALAMQKQMLKDAPWTGEHEEALGDYTGSDYGWINSGLRNPAERESWGEDAFDRLRTVQESMRPLPQGVTVTRNTNLASYGISGGTFTSPPRDRRAGLEELRKLEGKTFQEPAFLSTSIDENNSFPGGVVLHLTVPKGTPAAYLESVSGLPGEHEMLLAAGLKMRIESVDISGERAVVRASALPHKSSKATSPPRSHTKAARRRSSAKMSALSDPDNMALRDVAEHGDLFDDPEYRRVLGVAEATKTSKRSGRMRRKHLPGEHSQQSHAGHDGPVEIPGLIEDLDVFHDDEYWDRFGDEMYSEWTESGLTARVFENGNAHLALDLRDSNFQELGNLEDAEGMRSLAETIRDVLDLDLESYGDDDEDEDELVYRASDSGSGLEFGRYQSGDVSIRTEDGGRMDISEEDAEALVDNLESVAEVWEENFEYTERKSGLRRKRPIEVKEGRGMATKSFSPTIKAVGNSGEGTATIKIASFGEVDKDGDVTQPGFFGTQHVQFVPTHNWDHVWLGKGKVYEKADGAYCDVKFNLKIGAARDWYEAIKFDFENPPSLAEYSYGYNVLPGGSKSGQHQGRQVRFLQPRDDGSPGVEVFEVGSVMKGAGTDTGTVSVKGRSMRNTRTGGSGATSASRAVKGAIPCHETKTVSRAWDRVRTENALPDDARPSELRTVYAWVDPDGDPELKASYSWPHHHGIGGPANLRACLMGIAALNGSAGADMGDERKGIYDHLAGHLKDADREPPALRDRGTGPTKQYDELSEGLAIISGLIDGAYSGAALRREKGRGLSGAKAELLTWMADDLTRLKSLLSNPVEPETPEPDDDEVASVFAASIARLHGITPA